MIPSYIPGFNAPAPVPGPKMTLFRPIGRRQTFVLKRQSAILDGSIPTVYGHSIDGRFQFGTDRDSVIFLA